MDDLFFDRADLAIICVALAQYKPGVMTIPQRDVGLAYSKAVKMLDMATKRWELLGTDDPRASVADAHRPHP